MTLTTRKYRGPPRQSYPVLDVWDVMPTRSLACYSTKGALQDSLGETVRVDDCTQGEDKWFGQREWAKNATMKILIVPNFPWV